MKQILKFAQIKKAYRYNSDSLLLIDFILKHGIKNEVLDVGCGCGIIGILLKYYQKNLYLNLLDIQEQNIKLTQINLKNNNIKADLFHKDFKEFESEKKFDFLVSNPPFYKENITKSENSHKNISKNASSLALKDFIQKSNSLLKPQGILYFCYEACELSKICVHLDNNKFKITKIRFIHSKKNQKARLVLIQARKGVQSPCEILTPLFVYKKNHNLSKEMQKICSKFRIESYDI